MSDVALAKPFVQATINVLSSMTGLSPVPGKPYVKKTDKAQGDVSAIVGITGCKSGAVALSFSQSCAIALVKGMLGDAIEDIIADTRDAVGEITNMISGQARAPLSVPRPPSSSARTIRSPSPARSPPSPFPLKQTTARSPWNSASSKPYPPCLPAAAYILRSISPRARKF